VAGNERARVVVTGIGILCGLGIGRTAVWRTAVAGGSGARPITRFEAEGFGVTIASEVPGFEAEAFMDRRTARRADPASQMAIAAGRLAVEDADISITDGGRAGALIASGTGGSTLREEQHRVFLERGPGRVSPFAIPHSIPNMPAAMVAMDLGLRGPVYSTTSACAASTDAIGTATEIIRRGDADVMLAGGSDAMVTPLWIAAFDAMRVLTSRPGPPEAAPRPFDRDRDGFVVGEGAAALVLESLDHALARGAEIVCELAGYGATADARHVSDPDPTGEPQGRAMSIALRDAGVPPEAVGYVNAHGGGSQPGDPAEALAIALALGPDTAARTPVSATKSMHGHCLGAAGAVEGALTALAVRHGVIPPTINLHEVDPACAGVDHVANVARETEVRVALSTSNGLGGHNAALCFRAYDGLDAH
jgi:3-oxoacyl-[acyl-carrier-protein] synthase II